MVLYTSVYIRIIDAADQREPYRSIGKGFKHRNSTINQLVKKYQHTVKLKSYPNPYVSLFMLISLLEKTSVKNGKKINVWVCFSTLKLENYTRRGIMDQHVSQHLS